MIYYIPPCVHKYFSIKSSSVSAIVEIAHDTYDMYYIGMYIFLI